MNDCFQDLTVWAFVIFLIWSIALIWGSWQLRQGIRELALERRELRRWKRLSAIRDNQQRDWN